MKSSLHLEREVTEGLSPVIPISTKVFLEFSQEAVRIPKKSTSLQITSYEMRPSANGNGEGGIRTHEGVTPTRFRVVRIQPDSATSPHAIRRWTILVTDLNTVLF